MLDFVVLERTVMGMHALATNARIIVLTATVIGLGTWHVFGMRAVVAQDPGVPPPRRALVEDRWQAPDGSDVESQAAGREHGLDLQPAAGSPPTWIEAGSSVQGQVHDSLPGTRPLLDEVFAPERFVQAPIVGQPAGVILDAEGIAAGQDKLSSPASLTAVAPAVSAGDAGLLSEKARSNEKAYYEEYLALAKEDAMALSRQAASVLARDGESARQVALLRALYGTDRGQALEHFSRAMASLPDVSRPSGVSVPVFAASFLARQSGDPAAVVLAERIAWGGHLHVSQEVRNAAASVLLSLATPDDLQRYTAYPDYKPPKQDAVEP